MRVKWRKDDGRFSRPPSLEQLGAVKVCAEKTCRQFLVKTNGKFPEFCPRCGKPSNAQTERPEVQCGCESEPLVRSSELLCRRCRKPATRESFKGSRFWLCDDCFKDQDTAQKLIGRTR